MISIHNSLKKHICFMVFLCTLCCIMASCSNSGNDDSYAIANAPSFEDMPDFDYAADRTQMQVQIDGDGSVPPYRFNGLQPYFDEMGMTMFPMVHFNKLFDGNISYKIDGNKVTFTKNVLDIVTVVSVTADSNIMLRDGQEIIMNTTPVQKDGTIYIPLEFVGNALSYGVWWDDRLESVKFYQYTSVYIYVFNENENSSSSGLRYSYIISGDYTVDMSKIMANTTSDYNNILALLKKLPKEAEVCTTRLYRVKGYDVPYDRFESITDNIFDMGLKSSYTDYCLDEIPPIIKDLSDFTNDWYSQELLALDEEAIYTSKGQIYRFSCFPSFSDQVVVRIEINNYGTADLYYKVGDGIAASGYGGGISRSEKAELNQNETQEFLAILDNADYWSLPIEIESSGLDGHNIIVEGVKDGKYHIIDRWVPEETDPVVYRIEEYFSTLIKQKFTE